MLTYSRLMVLYSLITSSLMITTANTGHKHASKLSLITSSNDIHTGRDIKKKFGPVTLPNCSHPV